MVIKENIGLRVQGGLGIEVLELKNKCLIRKWLFKLLTEQGGYGTNSSIKNAFIPKFYHGL
jgi:hypothetical protein